MTELDEAIKDIRMSALLCERDADSFEQHGGNFYEEKAKACRAVAEETYRLADWLEELQKLREGRPQGDVDAVAIFEREMHNLEQGYITIGEFDERIEPLRHLCYGRPRGEWKAVKASIYPYGYDVKCSVCGFIMGSSYGFKYCPHCGAEMKGEESDE